MPSHCTGILLVMKDHSHCPKMNMNEEKMSQFQFHFPGLLVPYPMPKFFLRNPTGGAWSSFLIIGYCVYWIRWAINQLINYWLINLQEFVGLIKDGPLNVTNNVAIFTNKLGKCNFANFRQLSLSKATRATRMIIFVPITITSFQLLKLNSCKEKSMFKQKSYNLGTYWKVA